MGGLPFCYSFLTAYEFTAPLNFCRIFLILVEYIILTVRKVKSMW